MGQTGARVLVAVAGLTLAAGCGGKSSGVRADRAGGLAAARETQGTLGAPANASGSAPVARTDRKTIAQYRAARQAAMEKRPDWDWLGLSGKPAGARPAGQDKRPDWDWLGLAGPTTEHRSRWGHLKVHHKSPRPLPSLDLLKPPAEEP